MPNPQNPNFYKYLLSTILIIILLLFSIIISIKLFFYSNDREPFVEVTSNFEGLENIDILQSYKGNIIINKGGPGDWDESIREIGNIVYHSTFGQYFFFYSGHQNEYNQNNVFVGMAYSDDGKSWYKHGKAIEVPAEDPYVTVHDNRFYLFYEDKNEIPFRKIDLATSADGKSWTIVKRGVIQPTIEGWQSQDVSSPVIIETKDSWVMLYEGRGPGNGGKIGYATSKNLIDWDKSEEPIFEGNYPWSIYVVPDDVFQENESYILSYHGYSKKLNWQSGLAISTDLINWHPLDSFPIHPANTIMITKIDSQTYFFGISEKGVEYYIPLKGIEKNNKQ